MELCSNSELPSLWQGSSVCHKDSWVTPTGYVDAVKSFSNAFPSWLIKRWQLKISKTLIRTCPVVEFQFWVNTFLELVEYLWLCISELFDIKYLT